MSNSFYPEYNLPPPKRDVWYFLTKIAEAFAATTLGCVAGALGVIIITILSYISGGIALKMLGKLYPGIVGLRVPWEASTFLGFIVLLFLFSGWGIGVGIINKMKKWHLL